MIRPIVPADASEWSRMRSLLWPGQAQDTTVADFFNGTLREPAAVLVATQDDNALRGFVEVSVRRDYVEGASSTPVAYIEGWYVDPQFRGRGIGRGLIEGAEQWAVAQGLTELASDCELENELSMRAHQASGFTVVCRAAHFIKPVRARGEI
jgi:aminoglycoside 6'-N-acetyltransferase I